MKKKKLYLLVLDILLFPLFLPTLYLLKVFRKKGVWRMPLTKWLCHTIGVFPIRDHYYEPLFNTKHLLQSLTQDRHLPGINFNINEQLQLLKQFHYNDELERIPFHKVKNVYYYNNTTFGPGDSEYLYNIIRYFKPRRLIEAGCGRSTLMALNALEKNKEENSDYHCEHICIEPYETPFFVQRELHYIKKRIEQVELDLFQQLKKNDILFIDSSHMIRPQGDVLYEFLEILPTLHSGVLVHVHDIFTPQDYPNAWIKQSVRFWNEQYLLEAFLAFNKRFHILGTLNLLKHHHPEKLFACCPILRQHAEHYEPGSFWMRVD